MLPKSAMKKGKKIIGKSVNYRERHWFRDNEIKPLGTTTFITLKDISSTPLIQVIQHHLYPHSQSIPTCILQAKPCSQDKGLETGVTAANCKEWVGTKTAGTRPGMKQSVGNKGI